MPAIFAAVAVCMFDGCQAPVAGRCECCSAETPFCEDHGSPSRDRSGADGARAWPAACWQCGGFNADA